VSKILSFVYRVGFLLILALGLPLQADAAANDREVLYQHSTIDALLEGVYDGTISYEEVGRHGDFGIGTFNQLDGEMIAFDGEFFQIKADGIARVVDSSMLTPFVSVTFFDVDESFIIEDVENYDALKSLIDEKRGSNNLFYAIKITGTFKTLKTRSVPKQKRPYPKIVEIVKNQPTFEFQNVEGTLVGFWSPAFTKGINVPGFHFHFLTKDKTAGGHVLEIKIREAKVEMDETRDFFMTLPNTEDFDRAALQDDKTLVLDTVE